MKCLEGIDTMKSILKELFKNDYKITSIKRFDSGLIKAQEILVQVLWLF